ncbi:cysteine desulfurase, SufS subfamily [Actinomyces sp. Chiba101]|uniref:aminotransferase class V-fold PLP-dependent enzyme n=1 Tax=Actinomyces TaxID=1654 RepID=UPI000974E1C4|nr:MULTISPECIES: aminotransferase class V-fold PLP-dependent enzyme [Actinomyces]BAW93308.1 cysteine desulfurase, SufS subfamily [Actinomyces sp. Chiba101]GAV95456.1 cysteine desulfurase, SufS subfamily [Actinomyces denticolens]SUU03771.1 Probable cysteine desulfurase [Actinomyces denticolens]
MSAPAPTESPAAEPLSAVEVARARKDFPYLERPARNGRELAYLDWAATAQKPRCVLDAESVFYRMSNGAAGRSTYQLADEATASLEDAREAIAAFVGARAGQLVFTKNATEAINLVALAIGHASLARPAAGGPGAAPEADPARRLALGPGDEIVVTRAEHHANLVPWQELAARTGATLRWLDLDDVGRIDPAALDVITGRTRVLALGHASNVTGAMAPLDPILAAARAVGRAGDREPVIVLDTCQTAPHMPLDFAALAAAGVDAMALSSHKMCGPTGVGALVATEELLDAMPPVLTGGSMIEVVTMESSTYMPPPARFEAGSQPLAQAAGWHAAVDYLGLLGMDRLRAREAGLTAHALNGMRRVPGLRIIGPDDDADRLGVIAFTIEGVHPHDVGQVLDAAGVAVRTGHHCAQPIHAHFGIHASSRVSFGLTTTIEEIDRFLEAVAGVQSYFRR